MQPTIEAEALRTLLDRRARLESVAQPACAKPQDLRAGAGAASSPEAEEIDAALARLAAGTYGRCEACGGAIGRQRLRALPAVRHCMTCGVQR